MAMQCCCACMQEGGNHAAKSIREKRREQHPTAPKEGRAAQSNQAAGERDGAKRADAGPRMAPKKNHSSEEQYQQRRVTTLGKGKGNGGCGGQEEGPTTDPEANTPRKRKGAGRGRPVLGSRTGLGKAVDPVGLRQRDAVSPKRKRDAGTRGRDGKGRVARATRQPQGTRTAWEAVSGGGGRGAT